MRIRKTNAIIGVSLAIGALFMVYLVVDTLSVGYEDPEILQVKAETLFSSEKLTNDVTHFIPPYSFVMHSYPVSLSLKHNGPSSCFKKISSKCLIVLLVEPGSSSMKEFMYLN